MAERVIMPKQGLQMTEGTMVEWLVKEGGEVKEGEPLFVIETDKLTIQIDALVSGTLLKIVAHEGDVVPITGLIAVVGTPGEDISAILADSGPAGEAAPVAAQPEPDLKRSVTATASAGGEGGERVFISPRARMRAEELGLDWRTIRGSGPEGLVVEKDVLAAKAGGAKTPATPLARKTAEIAGVDLAGVQGTGARGKITRSDVLRSRGKAGRPETRTIVPMRGMRKIIAERMKQSLTQNAQAFHCVAVRMDEAVRVRAAFEKAVGYNDLIALAVTRALLDFPAVNAEIVDEGIWQKDFVNLGIAVAVSDGLIVPVVKDADLLSIRALAAKIKELADKARNGTLSAEEYSGGSFTISNLGMYGLDEFMPIINPPETGILGVGKIEDTPVAVSKADGTKQVEIHPVMKLTLSYDHRVVDGAPAAQFLFRIKEYLEKPCLML